MSVKRREHSQVAVLDIGGEFYGDRETDQLEQALKNEVGHGTRRLLLNLYDGRMMNSTALGVMHAASRALEAGGCEVRLCAVGNRVKSPLVMLRLMEWFKVHDTENEAIAAFTKTEAGA